MKVKDMKVKELRELTGLSQTAFGEKYGIPMRTIQNWEYGVRTAPEYVIDMLKKAIEEDEDKERVTDMKKFYIVKGEFANGYNLYYSDNGVIPKDGERISYEEACKFCESSKNSEGYADGVIWPANIDRDELALKGYRVDHNIVIPHSGHNALEVGTVYEDPEGEWEVTAINGETADIKNGNSGFESTVGIDEIMYWMSTPVNS